MSGSEERKAGIAVLWVRLGVIGGLAAASVGLFHFLGLSRESVASQLGMLFNLLASALVSAMFFVQLAAGMAPGEEKPAAGLGAVWLGLDVAWDVFISFGTFCFALAGWRHPRFGPKVAVPGLAIAGALLVLNLGAFPTPPGEAGLLDLGPAVGLWYLAVTIRILGSLPWAREAAFGPGK